MKSNRPGILNSFGCLSIFVKLIVVLIFVGYIKDIAHLTRCDFKPSYKAEILYGAGAVTGLGAIFGYCDFGK